MKGITIGLGRIKDCTATPVVRQNSDRLWNQQHSCCRLHQCSVITLRYVLFPGTLLRNADSPLSLASQCSSRESGTSSTACRAQKASSTPKVGFIRQALLAACSPMLVRLETITPSRHARNGGPMASRRIPLVLEGDFEGSKARGQKADIERGSGSHLPNDGRESRLGSSPHSRRTSHARF